MHDDLCRFLLACACVKDAHYTVLVACQQEPIIDLKIKTVCNSCSCDGKQLFAFTDVVDLDLIVVASHSCFQIAVHNSAVIDTVGGSKRSFDLEVMATDHIHAATVVAYKHQVLFNSTTLPKSRNRAWHVDPATQTSTLGVNQLDLLVVECNCDVHIVCKCNVDTLNCFFCH
jgi:hypothetical protein